MGINERGLSLPSGSVQSRAKGAAAKHVCKCGHSQSRMQTLRVRQEQSPSPGTFENLGQSVGLPPPQSVGQGLRKFIYISKDRVASAHVWFTK